MQIISFFHTKKKKKEKEKEEAAELYIRGCPFLDWTFM